MSKDLAVILILTLSENYWKLSRKLMRVNIFESENFRERTAKKKVCFGFSSKISFLAWKSFASWSSAISPVFHFSWWPKITTTANTQLDIGCDRSSTDSCSEIEVLIRLASISSENCDSTHWRKILGHLRRSCEWKTNSVECCVHKLIGSPTASASEKSFKFAKISRNWVGIKTRDGWLSDSAERGARQAGAVVGAQRGDPNLPRISPLPHRSSEHQLS